MWSRLFIGVAGLCIAIVGLIMVGTRGVPPILANMVTAAGGALIGLAIAWNKFKRKRLPDETKKH